MSIDDAITSHEKEIVCPGSKLSETLIKIREHGGWVTAMDVKLSTCTLHVVWTEREQPKQQQLI